MNSQGLARQFCYIVLLLPSILSFSTQPVFAQQGNDPLQLQKSGTAKLDHWMDYARRTGDAKSTVYELSAAQSDLKACYDLFMARQDFAGASLSAIKIGDIQKLVNQFRQAAAIYQGAIQLAQRANRSDYQTKALARLAFAELQLGDTDAAQASAREAVRLGEHCGNKVFYFEALDVAGEIEVKRGNLAAANEYLDRALAMAGEIDDKSQLYVGYMDRGDIYDEEARKCDYQRNFDVCYKSLELARSDYQKGLALTQQLGYTFFSQMFEGFIKQLDARKALIQGMQRGDQAINETKYFNPQKPNDVLVTERFTSGQMDPATLAFAETTVKQFHEWQARMQQQGLVVQTVDPKDLFVQGELAEMKGNNDEALAKYLQTVDLLEKDRGKLRDEQARGAFMEDKISYYYYPAQILLDRKRYSEAFALFERARSRAMADMLASRPLSLANPQDRALFSQLQTLNTSIAAKQARLLELTASPSRDQNAQQIAQVQKEISGLQQQHQQLEAQIAKVAPKLKELTSAEPVTLESVQRAAAGGGYDVLYYVVMEHAVVLWHINGSGVQVKNVFLPHSQLIKKTAALHDGLVARKNSPSAAFDETMSRQLFLYLIQPVLSSINSDHLIIVPQEELNSLPFQALQNPETGKYAGERFAISYAPSATVLATLASKSSLKGGKLLALANPEIPYVGEEVIAIGKLYPGQSKVVSQELASKENVTAWVPDYNLIHFSVHGKFNASEPLLSYLELKEVPPDPGHLTAAEMFGLPLQKNSLVVLSACETGRAEATHANEVTGMVRSLLYAGAGQLVLSSWEVDAASTRLWMETFYKEGQTKPPAEAARLALVAVKSRPEYSHPFFWAPFNLTGK